MFPGLPGNDAVDWRDLAEGTYRWGQDGRLHFDWDVNLVRAFREPREPLPDLWPFYRGLRRVPTLALRGAESDVLGAVTFARLAAEKPDLVAVTVSGVGHAPSLAEPAAEAAIDAFLARIDAQTG